MLKIYIKIASIALADMTLTCIANLLKTNKEEHDTESAYGISTMCWHKLTFHSAKRPRLEGDQSQHLTFDGAVDGISIALCCHQYCDWDRYCNQVGFMFASLQRK